MPYFFRQSSTSISSILLSASVFGIYSVCYFNRRRHLSLAKMIVLCFALAPSSTGVSSPMLKLALSMRLASSPEKGQKTLLMRVDAPLPRTWPETNMVGAKLSIQINGLKALVRDFAALTRTQSSKRFGDGCSCRVTTPVLAGLEVQVELGPSCRFHASPTTCHVGYRGKDC